LRRFARLDTSSQAHVARHDSLHELPMNVELQ
jgi:hypothetical protein